MCAAEAHRIPKQGAAQLNRLELSYSRYRCARIGYNDGRLNAEHAKDAETARSFYLLFPSRGPIRDGCILSGSEQRIPALVLGDRPPLGTICSIRQFP